MQPVAQATSYEWSIYYASLIDCTIDEQTGTISCPNGVFLPVFSNNLSNTFITTSPSATINWNSCRGTYAVNCKARNACGPAAVPFTLVKVGTGSTGGEGCRGTVQVAPNPVDGNHILVHYEIPNPNGPPCPTISEYDVQIFDAKGEKQFFQKYFNTSDFTIDNLGLTKNHYILLIITSTHEVYREIFFVP